MDVIPDVDSFVLDSLASFNLSEETLTNISLATSEAASNCISHGNNFNISLSFTIDIEISSESVKLSFKDKGKGFDPENLPDPTAPENIFKEHGRGIFIMKSLVRKLDFDFTDEGTTSILYFDI